MKNHLLRIFSAFLKSLFLKVGCLWLYCKSLILRRKLFVKDILCIEAIVIEGAPMSILWQTRGCHKIVVEKFGILRGDSHGAIIKPANCSKSVTLRFYGIGKSIRKIIYLNYSKVDLLNTFEADAKIPHALETIYSNTDLGIAHRGGKLKTPSITNWETSLSRTNLEVGIKEIHLKFEPFIINEIQPNNYTR